MVTQSESRRILADTILAADQMPEAVDPLLREPDGSGADANIELPVLIITYGEESGTSDHRNTEFVGYKENSSGQQIAEVYETQWTASVDMQLWTSDRSDWDVDDLGRRLYDVLYAYQTSGPDKTFTDESGNPVESLWHFSLDDGYRDDDLAVTPTVRRWRQTATLRGARYYVGEEQVPIAESHPSVNDEEQPDIN